MPDPTPPTIAYLHEAMYANRVINSYNGYVFPTACSQKVSIEPVYESSNRLPKYHRHTVTLEFIVTSAVNPQADATASSPVDYNIETLKRLLSIPGKALVLSRRGLGYTTVETDGGATFDFTVDGNNDLNFGPRPEILLWEPVGSSQAVRVQWTVSFSISLCCYPDSDGDGLCDGAAALVHSPFLLNLLEFNYSMSFAVDAEGWTNRAIVGTAVAPGHFATTVAGAVGTTPTSSIQIPLDKLRLLIQNLFSQLPRFRRDYQWDVSRDGTTVEFRITDSEIKSDNPLIAGLIDADVSHEIDSQLPFFKWSCTLSGSFTIQPGVSRDMGWTAFLIILNSRLSLLNSVTDQVAQEYAETGTVANKQMTPSYLPMRIRLKEEIFSRKSSFSFEYVLWCPLNKLLAACGLFRPTPGNWIQWKATQNETLFTGGGTAGLGTAGLNGMLTVCTGQLPTNVGTIGGISEASTLNRIFTSTCPPPDKSWIDYKLWFETESQASYAYHQPSYSAATDQNTTPASQTQTALRGLNGTYDPVSAQEENSTQSDPAKYPVYQTTSGYQHTVTMCGYAIRACYDIPIPSLVKYGNADKLMVVRSESKPRVLGGTGPVTFYARSWRITYLLPKGVGGSNATFNLKTTGVPADYLSAKAVDDGIFTTQVP